MKLKRLTSSALLMAFLLYSNGCKKDEPAGPSENHPPIISDIISSDDPIYSGRIVSLECIANDEDNDELKYYWSSEEGYLNPVIGNPVKWTSPEGITEDLEYKINVSVEDKKGEMDFKEVSLTVKCAYDTLYVIQDTFISDYTPEENNGDEEEIHLTKNDYMESIGLLEFSNFGEKEVRKAELYLSIYTGENDILHCDIGKITNRWYENNVTKITAPSYKITPSVRLMIIDAGEGGWGDYYKKCKVGDITDFVNECINDSSINYGMAIIPLEENVSKSFLSKESVGKAFLYDDKEVPYSYQPSIAIEH